MMRKKKELSPIFFTKETKLYIERKKLSFCLGCLLIGTVQQIHPLASSFSSLEISCQSVRLFVSLEMTLILISLFLYMYVSLSASSFFFSYSSCSITTVVVSLSNRVNWTTTTMNINLAACKEENKIEHICKEKESWWWNEQKKTREHLIDAKENNLRSKESL